MGIDCSAPCWRMQSSCLCYVCEYSEDEVGMGVREFVRRCEMSRPFWFCLAEIAYRLSAYHDDCLVTSGSCCISYE